MYMYIVYVKTTSLIPGTEMKILSPPPPLPHLLYALTMLHVHVHFSYGGMLTAWMRFKYPNLVDGGLAGSAPIYYTEDLVPRTAFFAKVTEVKSITHECVCAVYDG